MDNEQSMVGDEVAQETQGTVEAGEVTNVEETGDKPELTPEERAEQRFDAKLKRAEAKFEKRIGKVVAEKQYLAERQAQLESFLQKATEKPASKSDFKTQAEWDAYTQSQIAERAIAKHEGKKTEAQRATQAQQAVERGWQGKVETVIPRLHDYHEVVGNSEVNFEAIPDVFQAILESDLGPDLAYYLAKNPDEAEKMESLSPASRQRYLARIEIKLEAQANEPQRKAPKPTAPARAGGQGIPSSDPAKMSFKEYKAMRDQEDSKKYAR